MNRLEASFAAGRGGIPAASDPSEEPLRHLAHLATRLHAPPEVNPNRRRFFKETL